jgi:serine/threonine-protein kinase GIN4
MIKEMNSLTASPLHVVPYPPKPQLERASIPDTPARRQLESVYDRFLMATSGVKRVGAGYSSTNSNAPVSNHLTVPAPPKRHGSKIFNSSRRPMPPPVSSDDYLKAVSVDELGIIAPPGTDTRAQYDEGRNSFAGMRRALKAAVQGKTVSRRLSRID